MQNRPIRKLVVILHADIVESTALVQIDETLAHERIRKSFCRLSKIIETYGGTSLELRGDALVAQFGRASDAVSGAISFQHENAEFIATLVDDIKPWLRVGIAMGEVVIADGTITGEGVVIAQRLEQLAEPGGICVQGAAKDTIPKRLPFDFQSLGEVELKGFKEPVLSYRTHLKSGEDVPIPDSAVRQDNSVLELPNKPSIAVLPFTNLSGDPAQEYFSDGITEDIITNLSRFRDLFVIASNSSFSYKGKQLKIQDVSRELGVRYVLEGSVQRSGNRVRINAQLIDGATGSHLWAERYQREIDDIFVLQDEVVETIVGTLATGYGGRLRKAWQKRAERKESESFQAFDCFMRGMDAFDNFTAGGSTRGRELFEEAIRLDPNYGKAYAKLAWTYILDAVEGWRKDYDELMSKAFEIALLGVERDEEESWVHWVLGGYYIYVRQFDLAFDEFQSAMNLNPNDADVLADVGFFQSYAGKAEDGIESTLRAMRLNPHFPQYYLLQFGQTCFDAYQYERAISTIEKARDLETTRTRLYLAASHAALGDIDKAKVAIRDVLKLDPQANIQKWTHPKMAPYKEPEHLQHFSHNLKKAGLPN